MPPLAKDSVIMVLRAANGGGYFMELWCWDESPPPVPFRNLDRADTPPKNRQDRVFADKDELKTQFAAFIDNLFDQ